MSALQFPLEINPFQVKTRRQFNEALERDSGMARMAIAKVFVHEDTPCAFTAEKIAAIASARFDLPLTDHFSTAIQNALTGLVREGVLRSYRERGRRLYEVVL